MIRGFLAVALFLAMPPAATASTSSCQERAATEDISGTIAACTAALAQNPEDAAAWAARGMAHARSKARDQAMIDFDRALGINPRLVSALEGRAQLNNLSGNPDSALADLTAALAIEPRNARLLQAAAETSHRLGKRQETIVFLERAGMASRRNPEPWLDLASLHKDDPRKQERYLNTAVRASNDNSRALHIRGHFHENNKNAGKAADDFRAAVRISPSDAHLYADLARVLQAQGKNKDAMAVLDQGLALKADQRLLNQRLPLRLATGNPLGAADDLRAWHELATPPQGDRLEAQVTQAIYDKYVPGLHAAMNLTTNLQAPALDCSISASAMDWLEAQAKADGQVAKARESLARQQVERYSACLDKAQPQPTARFAEIRQSIAAANDQVTAGSTRMTADCAAFPMLVPKCAQLAETFQKQSSALLANLRQHEEAASMRRLAIAEHKRQAGTTTLAAIDKASAALDRSARALFAEHVDTGAISSALSRARAHSAPAVARECPSPSLRAANTEHELSRLNSSIEQYRSCLEKQHDIVNRRMPDLNRAAELLTAQRHLLDALGNQRCSRNRGSGCIADDTWTRASNLIPASAVSSARSTRDAHHSVQENTIPALLRQLSNQIAQLNEAVESHNRRQTISEAVNTFSETLNQGNQQNRNRGGYFGNPSSSAPGIR